MSITTDAPVAATLPEAAAKPAKRTPRKAAPGKAVAPAKATKAPAKAKADKQMYIASAKGRGGEINRRKVGFATAWGVDVADSSSKKAALVAGQIWAFFPSEEKATAWAAKKQAEGYDCVVVKATTKPVTK